MVVTDFIRHRNVLIAHGDLSPIFVDYYLHLADQHIRHTPEHDRLLHDALAAFVLHCASRPRTEHLAWTINFQDPRVNLFLVGDNEDGNVAGRIFTENVREAPENVFYSDIAARQVGQEKRRSVVNFTGDNALRAVEKFYEGSEQRIARMFELGDDRYAFLVSHPDCDEAWLRAIDLEGVKQLPKTETLARIESRRYTWHCGCNQRKILAALAPAARGDLDGFFGSEESVRVSCPRCAATHVITREAMEAWLAPKP